MKDYVDSGPDVVGKTSVVLLSYYKSIKKKAFSMWKYMICPVHFHYLLHAQIENTFAINI